MCPVLWCGCGVCVCAQDANPLALDLLDRMLVFNPHKRISVDEALAHPYLKTLHNVKTESECKRTFDFEFEKNEMTKEVIQEFMWQEIQHFRPELRTKTWRRDGKTTVINPLPPQPTHSHH